MGRRLAVARPYDASGDRAWWSGDTLWEFMLKHNRYNMSCRQLPTQRGGPTLSSAQTRAFALLTGSTFIVPRVVVCCSLPRSGVLLLLSASLLLFLLFRPLTLRFCRLVASSLLADACIVERASVEQCEGRGTEHAGRACERGAAISRQDRAGRCSGARLSASEGLACRARSSSSNRRRGSMRGSICK